jgi:tRNA-splicing ligase RtcB
MKPKELIQLGIPRGNPMAEVFKLIQGFLEQGGTGDRLPEEISAVLANPTAHVDDPIRGAFANALLQPDLYRADRPPAPWQRWGSDIDALALRQIELASNLPVSVAGALMPDAHVGYGLPIGGVLATDNSVIPYAVGVDIACRMKMTVLDLPVEWLEERRERLAQAIEAEAKFGVGATFKSRRSHDVMDEHWDVSPVTAKNKDRAWAQLGTSGSGNHFVEFGLLALEDASCGLARGN